MSNVDDLDGPSESQDPEKPRVPLSDDSGYVDDVTDDADFEEGRSIPAWSEYRKAPIFRNLSNILGFDLLVEVPRMYQWVGGELAPYVVSRMYEEVMVVLDSAAFYSFERISATVSSDRAGVTYLDDEFGFSVYFEESGNLRIERSGSTLERFYHWYVRIMPSLTSLVNRILTAVADVLRSGRDTSSLRTPSRPLELRPVGVQYSFRFLAYDFTRPPSEDVDRNVVILRELLRAVPGPTGHLHDATKLEQAGHFGRIDIALSRFMQDRAGEWAREIYRMEAPSNRRYTTLWFDFIYKGETFETPEGERVRFSPDAFLHAYELPFVDFLKQRVIEGFLTQLTASTMFETSTGSLP